MTENFRVQVKDIGICLYPLNGRNARKWQYRIVRENNSYKVFRRGFKAPICVTIDRFTALEMANIDWLEFNGHLETGRKHNAKKEYSTPDKDKKHKDTMNKIAHLKSLRLGG